MRIFILFLLLYPLCVFSQEKAGEKAAIEFGQLKAMQHANFSLLVADVQTGEILATKNASQSIIPASTLKLLTTATALEMLGKNFTFKTKLAYDGKITDGTLKGNLYIIGGGDPALGSPRFGKFYRQPNFLDVFASAIQKAGIRNIDGNIIADASLYGKYQTPGTWTWEDIGNYWGAQPFSISVYDNMYTAYFDSPTTAGNKAVVSSINHKKLEIHFDNQVVASESRRDNAYIFGAPLQNERYVVGEIPKNRKLFPVKGSIPNPPKFFAQILKNKLQENKINITGQVEVHFEAKQYQRASFFTFPSPNLQMLVLTTNLRSVNLYAEHMLRQLGLRKANSTDVKASLGVVKDFWTEKGMNTEGMHLYDGSGLSHYNTITAEQMVFLLRYMSTKAKHKFSFKNSLPVMAKSGTLGYMGRGTSAANRVWAKSGSMNQIRTYAGYISTKSNKELCFFLAINHYNGTTSEIKSGIVNLLSNFVDTL